MSIAKIIHQVWEGRTEPCMPVRLQILARTWREQNPDWEYHLWTGGEMDELVSTHFPEYFEMYKNFPRSVQRWDTIRYMILYQYGGVYADLDTECFRPIDTLLEKEEICFGQEPLEHNTYPGIALLVGNAFMASQKGNAGWLEVLEEISMVMQRDLPFQRTVMNTTGPFMISRLFESLKERHRATCLPYEQVVPVTMRIIRQYIFQGKVDLFQENIKNAYCAHYFFGSWNEDVSIY